jgi:hypothetical protein
MMLQSYLIASARIVQAVSGQGKGQQCRQLWRSVSWDIEVQVRALQRTLPLTLLPLQIHVSPMQLRDF